MYKSVLSMLNKRAWKMEKKGFIRTREGHILWRRLLSRYSVTAMLVRFNLTCFQYTRRYPYIIFTGSLIRRIYSQATRAASGMTLECRDYIVSSTIIVWQWREKIIKVDLDLAFLHLVSDCHQYFNNMNQRESVWDDFLY